MLATGSLEHRQEALVIDAALDDHAIRFGFHCPLAQRCIFPGQHEDHRRKAGARLQFLQRGNTVVVVGSGREQYRIVALRQKLGRQRAALQRRMRADLHLGPLTAQMMPEQCPDFWIFFDQQQPHTPSLSLTDRRQARLQHNCRTGGRSIQGVPTALSPLRASRRRFLASSERARCNRSRYSKVTSPVTYSPEKHEVSNSTMFALSCWQAATRSSRS